MNYNSHVSNFKSTLFANDKVLSVAAKSDFDIKKANQEISNIDNWFSRNKQFLIYNKTHYMLFTKIPLEFDIYINI